MLSTAFEYSTKGQQFNRAQHQRRAQIREQIKSEILTFLAESPKEKFTAKQIATGIKRLKDNGQMGNDRGIDGN